MAKKIEKSLESIDFESSHKLETFYTSSLENGTEIEDEIHKAPKLSEVKLTEADMEEVKYYEELLRN